MSDSITALREVTRDVHERLHVHPLMTRHFLTGLSAQSYACFLDAFVEPWARLEAATVYAASAHLDALRASIVSRRAALSADLSDLPATPSRPDEAASLSRADSPGSAADGAVDGVGEFVGLAYTLLGSSQGARVLRREVLAQWPQAPVRYLTRSPSELLWADTVALLREVTLTERELRAAQEAALWCFEYVEAHFDKAHEVLSQTSAGPA